MGLRSARSVSTGARVVSITGMRPFVDHLFFCGACGAGRIQRDPGESRRQGDTQRVTLYENSMDNRSVPCCSDVCLCKNVFQF
jgi:hypothetical protein